METQKFTKMKRKDFIKAVETSLKCHLVSQSANLLHFKADTDDCPSNAEFERLLPSLTHIRRQHNILFERRNPKIYDTAFIFAGMVNIPQALIDNFGGYYAALNIWRLRNMSMYDTDSRGYKQEVLPTVDEIKSYILSIYKDLNPNLRAKDPHKKKVEILGYSRDDELCQCGSREFNRLIWVDAPAYLGAGSSIYIDDSKSHVFSSYQIYEYYGKGLCRKYATSNIAMLFSKQPEAVYDWFYSKQRTESEIAQAFETIERSYIEHPHWYYSKGEYNKVRQIFLIEAMRVLRWQSKEQIDELPKGMIISMLALCDKKLISKYAIDTHYSSLYDTLESSLLSN